MRPDVIQLPVVIFANAKPTLVPFICPSCEASVTRTIYVEGYQTWNQCSPVTVCHLSVFCASDCSVIPLCSLGSCQLCLCVTGCLMVDRLLWVVHWKQLGLPPPHQKASVSSSRVKRNSKVSWKDLQSGPREVAQSADNCLRYRSDIWNSK